MTPVLPGRRAAVLCLAALVLPCLAGCGKAKDPTPVAGREAPATPITVTRAVARDLPVELESVGDVESPTAPRVAAEVGARVERVLVDVGDRVRRGQPLAELDDRSLKLALAAAEADTASLQAMVHNQQLTVARDRRLLADKLVSQSQMDAAAAQLQGLVAQRDAARAHAAIAADRLRKTRIVSPVDGTIARRLVAAGDYIDVGHTLFEISADQTLQVHLPFPEAEADLLRPGLPVTLHSPTAPGRTLTARVSEVRPTVGAGSRAMDVIVDLDNPGGWRPGASVTGRVQVAVHHDAVMVPEQAVVRRPAGEVVYRIDGDRAHQQVVTIGLHKDGLVEVLTGLAAGTTVAVDGAGFLTDRTRVTVADSGS